MCSRSHGIGRRLAVWPARQQRDARNRRFGGDGTVHVTWRHWSRCAAVLVVPHASGTILLAPKFARRSGFAACLRQFASGRGKVRQIDLGVITSLNAAARRRHTNLHYRPQETRNPKVETILLRGEASDWTPKSPGLPTSFPADSQPGGYSSVFALLSASYRPSDRPRIRTDMSIDSLLGMMDRRCEVASPMLLTTVEASKIAPKTRSTMGSSISVWSENRERRDCCDVSIGLFGSHCASRGQISNRRLRLETERPMEVYADGEYVCCTPVEVTVERAALRVSSLARRTGL